LTSRWPGFFLVGAAKAGTTSLYASVGAHPNVFVPRVKEPHFFSTVDPPPHRHVFFPSIKSESEYLHLFEAARSDQVAGDGSTSYLWDPEAPGRIRRQLPNAKIVVILREPVDRAFSHYLSDVREGFERRPFVETIAIDLDDPAGKWGDAPLYAQIGFYASQLDRYLNAFEDVLVLFFEEFILDVPAHVDRVFRFIGVDPADATMPRARVLNSYGRPRNAVAARALGNPALRRLSRALVPPEFRPMVRRALIVPDVKPSIPDDARELLRQAYRGEPERLEQLVGRPVPWAGH
jgi:hypothetical protein